MRTRRKIKLSIVIPIYYNEENRIPFYNNIKEKIIDSEMVMVNLLLASIIIILFKVWSMPMWSGRYNFSRRGMKIGMKYFLCKNKEIAWEATSFLLLFCFTLVWLSMRNVTEFMWDSQYYWTVGDSIIYEGHWDILGYPETFRGYFLPVILLLMKVLGETCFGNSVLIFWIVTAALLTSIFTIILPYLFEKKVSNSKSFVRIILVYLVVLLFWGDYILYPLSDMIAFALLVSGVALLKKIYKGIKSNVIKIVVGMLAGICLYACYNTRAAYIYGVIGIVAIYLIMEIKARKIKWISWIAICMGVVICAMPQSVINHQYTGSYLPKVYTEQYTNYQTGLEMMQVYWGLTMPNYLTYVGSLDLYPEPGVYFDDKVGTEILTREGMVKESFSVGELLKLFIKYPQDMIGIYTRHLVSLLTPMFLETYIHNMYIDKGWFLSIMIIMWFITATYFLWSIANKKVNWILVLNLLAIFLPCLLQLAGAPESRFFLPIHFVMYFYILFYADFGSCKGYIKKNAITLIVVFGTVYILWIGVISDILKSNVYKTFLINDTNVYETQIESTE